MDGTYRSKILSVRLLTLAKGQDKLHVKIATQFLDYLSCSIDNMSHVGYRPTKFPANNDKSERGTTVRACQLSKNVSVFLSLNFHLKKTSTFCIICSNLCFMISRIPRLRKLPEEVLKEITNVLEEVNKVVMTYIKYPLFAV